MEPRLPPVGIDSSLMIRTDFGDDAAWAVVIAAAASGVHVDGADGLFAANLECVDDRQFDGMTIERVVTIAADAGNPGYVFLADHETISHPEHPILAVDLAVQPGRSFRVIPSEMQGVQNNLSIAGMDFAEFADFVDSDETGRTDGIFRGFPNY